MGCLGLGSQASGDTSVPAAAGQSQRDKGAASTCRSWRGCSCQLSRASSYAGQTAAPGPDGEGATEETGESGA